MEDRLLTGTFNAYKQNALIAYCTRNASKLLNFSNFKQVCVLLDNEQSVLEPKWLIDRKNVLKFTVRFLGSAFE